MADAALQGVRVFLVDDHPAVREGLSLLLANKGLIVCGEADHREDALRLLSTANPEVVLVDLSLGDESGIDLIEAVRESGMKILVYSMHDDAGRVEAALAAGADGYVTKREMAATLLEAIGSVLAGDCYLSPVAEAARRQAVPVEGVVMVERLSDRELELFRKMGEGYSTADLARHFDISPSTVETYYARIMEKLDLFGAKEIRLRAIRFMKAR
jgi:DNA-binding NarL/FixJ family response regulator